MQRIYKDYTKKPDKVNVIKYHQGTGLAVWLYMGPSKEAMRRQYYRTVECERRRQRQWPKVQQRWRESISHLLDECIASLPITGSLTSGQRDAIRTLRDMADNPPEFSSSFLEYDREQRHQHRLMLNRQHYWRDVEYRKAERERKRKAMLKRRKRDFQKNNDNRDYDK